MITDWLLENYGTEVMRPGLDRMNEVLASIMPALSSKKIVTIAGTNGKGETTLRLSGELSKIPHKVWTSPHIERITERFRDENGEIELSKLEALIKTCHAEVQAKNYKLSYYEFLFFVFCTWAAEGHAEILLLEVGLGGRLDAVNVLDAELVLLPSISRDHQEILGKRYDLILGEKLGVMREGATLISMVGLQYLKERILKRAEEKKFVVIDLDGSLKIQESHFSVRNAFLAHSAYLHLMKRPLDELHSWSFKSEFLENRGEVLRGKNDFVFFGSHNTDGLRKLIQFLHSENYTFLVPPFDFVLVAFSKRDAQDLSSMVRMLKSANLGKVVVTAFEHPKALTAEVAESLSRQEGLDFVFDTIPLVQGRNNQRILVTGSYYFLGSIKQRLRGTSEDAVRR